MRVIDNEDERPVGVLEGVWLSLLLLGSLGVYVFAVLSVSVSIETGAWVARVV